MITKFIRLPLLKFASAVTLVALLSLMIAPSLALATSFTNSKDTSTRLKISTTADHTIVFTLPTGVDFDSTTQTDAIHIDFPTSFTTSGTWVAGDFTLNDGTARTSVTPSQGAGTIDCTVAAGTNNFCVAIDTTNMIFTIKPSSTWTASATGATVTFTIDGTATDGTLTNPSSVAATNIDFQLCDETASCLTSFTTSHSSQVAFAVVDDDQVNVSATVNSTISFDLDTASGGGNGESSAPYNVAFGTLSTTDVKSSGTTDVVQQIVAEADSNASGGVVVTVANANGASGLKSTSTPADTIPSADGTMATATTNYGLCVATSGLSGWSRAAPYNSGTCAVDGETNDIQALTTTGENILSTSGPVASAHAEIVANASIDGVVKAHNDYNDTLTLIATGTF